jgi:hypothetical protein
MAEKLSVQIALEGGADRPVSVRPRSLSSLAATFVGSTGDEDPRDEKRHVESPDSVLL